MRRVLSSSWYRVDGVASPSPHHGHRDGMARVYMRLNLSLSLSLKGSVTITIMT